MFLRILMSKKTPSLYKGEWKVTEKKVREKIKITNKILYF